MYKIIIIGIIVLVIIWIKDNIGKILTWIENIVDPWPSRNTGKITGIENDEKLRPIRYDSPSNKTNSNGKIKLENNVVINEELTFIMTKSAVNLIGGIERTKKMSRYISSQKALLMSVRDNNGSYIIKVYFPQGVINCKINNDKNGLMVTAFSKSSLNDTNIALSKGMVFYFDNVSVKLTLDRDTQELYSGGIARNYYDDNSRDFSSQEALRGIIGFFRKNNITENEPENKIEEKENGEELLRMLDTAEHYSVLSYELETKKIIESGKTSYISIEPVEYDRKDRTAYKFGVFEMDEQLFKNKVQVVVEDKEGNIHSAEIISVIKEDDDSPATAIVLLFEKQISIKNFESSGFISLSSSTVNRDVQCEAIRKIRNKQSTSKYMDNVIGENSPAGFENKDLSEVENRLRSKKYPPNESQMEAIRKGINSKDAFLVMGPPGTGKTTVILEWIKYFVLVEKKRVLVSSQNNKAVDNVLARIAEEKDIDMIRIGSENKLQSEIVPYMFENKLVSLRNNIETHTDKSISELEKIIRKWTKYRESFDAIYDTYKLYLEEYRKFKNVVENKFHPVYRDMKRLSDDIEIIRRKLQKSKDDIERLYSNITNYENSGILSKAIRFLPNLNDKRIIKNKIKQHNYYNDEYRKNISKYQEHKKELIDIYNCLFYENYNSVYELYQKVNDSTGDVINMPFEIEENRWNLFSDLFDIQINSIDDFAKVRKGLDENFEKANSLKLTLEEWHSDMVNSQNYALNSLILENVNLVGATCIGINSQKRFASLKFDVTIIDEAGQIQIHNALVPMSVSNKLIMLGDHKQIPPQADSELMELCENNDIETELLEKSLFEKMYENLPESNKTMLDTQYRMPGEIADVISDWFYDGKYFSHESKRNLKSPVPSLSSKPFLIIDTSAEANRFETKIEGAGCYNELEGSITKKVVEHIIDKADYDTKEIGVISAYSSQVSRIKKKLKGKIGEDVKEMVATLDSFQGQERDIIIYSFTKSSKVSRKYKRIGFLKELRRLNVAMSRCKKMLVLVGDMEFLRNCMNQTGPDGEEKYEKSEKQFSDFIGKICDAVDNGSGEMISYEKLKERLGGE